jgi:uncharacterized protein (DUF58 family)
MATSAAKIYAWSDRAQALSQGLPPLLVRAEKIAATVILGVHGRKRAGPGESFWQYRPYGFGDSTQRIDWRRSALSDRMFIRESEWEAANTLWVWADSAPRMAFKSHLAKDTKRDRALLITLALASLAVRAHERIGGLGSERPASYGRAALVRLAEHLLEDRRETLPVLKQAKRFSAAVIASDFLDTIDEISKRLSQLAAAGIKGHLLQIADPAEETLPYEGRIRFEGLDTVRDFIAPKTQDLRAAYEAKYRAHLEEVRALARRLGWTFSVHRTDQDPTRSIMALFAHVYDNPNRVRVSSSA